MSNQHSKIGIVKSNPEYPVEIGTQRRYLGEIKNISKFISCPISELS